MDKSRRCNSVIFFSGYFKFQLCGIFFGFSYLLRSLTRTKGQRGWSRDFLHDSEIGDFGVLRS